jgi:hypothetical protein
MGLNFSNESYICSYRENGYETTKISKLDKPLPLKNVGYSLAP